MIELTRLNGHRLIVNCDLIKFAEATPDTILTLMTGEKVVVRDSLEDVCERTRVYRSQVLRTAWPAAAAAHSVYALDCALNSAPGAARQADTPDKLLRAP